MNIEVAHARAQKMVQDIQEKAANTQVFQGEIESKQTLCPSCGKPAGEGKFCNNCGTPLSLIKCKKCGATSPAGTRFCGECGNKLA
jgi:membrane protease subunit (stomatin/prohibitin family)